MSINERIKDLIKFDNKTQNTFCEKIGVKQTTLSSAFSKNSSPNYTTILPILKTYPSLRAEWLLLGEEPMWKEQVKDYEQRIKDLEQRIKELEEMIAVYKMVIKSKLPDEAKELNL